MAETTLAKPASRRGRKPRIAEDQILREATALLDSAGAGGFTMRALADALGVTPMAIYRYFPDKDALLDATAAQVLAGVATEATHDSAWHERLESAMTEMHDALAAHPAVVEIILARYVDTVDDFRGRLGAIVAESGLTKRERDDALRTLTSYVIGFVGVTQVRRRAGAPLHESPDAFEFGLALMIDSLRDRAK